MALFSKEPEKSIRKDNSITPSAPAASTFVPPPTNSSNAPAASAAAPKPMTPSPSEGRAYLDRGTKISGKVSFDGPARVDGELDGELTAKDAITIGESAVITAHIRAASVIVAGKVSGDISASQRIEIRPSAKVQGNLAAPVLVVHEGAVFEGHCSMQADSVREDRKVTVFPKEERVAQAAAGQKQA
jgi:cytoskeletal protein CcmA (bactofilin family)